MQKGSVSPWEGTCISGKPPPRDADCSGPHRTPGGAVLGAEGSLDFVGRGTILLTVSPKCSIFTLYKAPLWLFVTTSITASVPWKYLGPGNPFEVKVPPQPICSIIPIYCQETEWSPGLMLSPPGTPVPTCPWSQDTLVVVSLRVATPPGQSLDVCFCHSCLFLCSPPPTRLQVKQESARPLQAGSA